MKSMNAHQKSFLFRKKKKPFKEYKQKYNRVVVHYTALSADDDIERSHNNEETYACLLFKLL